MGTALSTPSSPSGSETSAPTSPSERSGSVIVTVRLVSAAAVNGSASSESAGWNGRGPEHGALGAATVVIGSSGWAAGGPFGSRTAPFPRNDVHDTTSPANLCSPHADGVTSGANF